MCTEDTPLIRLPFLLEVKASSASFFDLDHTLLKHNSSFCFGKYLFRHKILSYSQLLQLGSTYLLHRAKILSMATLHTIVFKRLFHGQPKSFFKRHIHFFLEENFENMLYLPAIHRLKEAQLAGHFTAILSNSPDFLVEEIAKKLNVNYFESSIYAINNNGCFSHIQSFVQAERKAISTQQIAKALEIKKENTTIYSDSILDLEFLLSGGVKVGVNPDRPLRRLCRKNGWEMI